MKKVNQNNTRRVGRPRMGTALVWLALLALALVAGVWGGWRGLEHSMTSRIRARLATIPAHPGAGAPQIGGTDGGKGIPLAELECLRDEFLELRLDELSRWHSAVGNWRRERLSCREFLGWLGRGVTRSRDVSEEEAAAVLLREADGVRRTIELVRRDVGRGPWKWDTAAEVTEEQLRRRRYVFSMLHCATDVEVALCHARWLTGDHAAGREAMWLVHRSAARAREADPVTSVLLQSCFAEAALTLLERGASTAGWSDEDLTAIIAELPAPPSLEEFQATLGFERARLVHWGNSPTMRQTFRDWLPAPEAWYPSSLGDLQQILTKTMTSDEQITEILNLAVGDVDQVFGRIDLTKGVLEPAPAGFVPVSVEFLEGANWWEHEVLWAMICCRDDARTIERAFVECGSNCCRARILGQVELYRRRHGEYPVTLDAVRAAGLDVPERGPAGQSIHYARGKSGGFELWMGIEGAVGDR